MKCKRFYNALKSPVKEIIQCLENEGWVILIAGFQTVESTTTKYKFRYVFEFIGVKKASRGEPKQDVKE